ncbi:Glycolipid transfer protein domain containing protein [Trema orientale]|uniref:Glycolipid transfer protein domain containing protein n=1 Tax=Trema orientale TaxID=63057 RepID=A0A2P5E8D3_TREOI|nr:Glycolipid transfer protein domain containing protein [Trema orientale]
MSIHIVSDKFGAALAPVKSDVGNNIQRLESKYLSNPSEFKLLYSLVRSEIEAKTAKASSSCANALLWLTRHGHGLRGGTVSQPTSTSRLDNVTSL